MVSNDHFHKSLRLMSNIPESAIRPLLQRCENSHKHQIVQGRYPNGMSKTLYTQIYPAKFCHIYAQLLTAFLKSRFDNKRYRDETSWFVTSEDEPYLDDYDHYRLIDDLLEAADASILGDEALAVVWEDINQGVVEGIEDANASAFYIVTPTHDLTKLQTWVDSLPKGADVDLKFPTSRLAHQIVPLAQSVRKYFLPTHRFDQCRVLRGTVGSGTAFYLEPDS